MDPVFIISLGVLGAVTGLAAGLLGIGGGMILVPFLTFLLGWTDLNPNLVVKAAIATSMASILFTSVSSVTAHHKKSAVRWKLVFAFAPGIFIGSLFAKYVFETLPTAWLALLFALFVAYSGLQMLLDKKPKPTRQMPGPAGTVVAGTGIGFLSGLVGAGGGFVSVPFMAWCNVPLREAIGTSAALGFPIALFNTIQYAQMSDGVLANSMIGLVYWPALLILAAFSVLTAPVGARLAHKLPVKQLKRVFAYLLFGLSAYMAYKAYAAFI
ncbi:putative membrane protein YfcA [Jezberella montanilacus]|jgi:uncharacterized membrane protein YfcA|uniref:Probable membrane transporter protein n=1 Tax=Jezberella montanilacus TaxID=323426 RepID=A0A2T0XGU5_9BURK|nr:sulfite exporter TauE/SafE family protein [Jezberella montanilacus]PRY98135.1 putative membrane protein YfcA [Jezberella montanilacus]|eukprot:gene3315-3359_t